MHLQRETETIAQHRAPFLLSAWQLRYRRNDATKYSYYTCSKNNYMLTNCSRLCSTVTVKCVYSCIHGAPVIIVYQQTLCRESHSPHDDVWKIVSCMAHSILSVFSFLMFPFLTPLLIRIQNDALLFIEACLLLHTESNSADGRLTDFQDWWREH